MNPVVSVIDDEPSVRDAITLLLETRGYAVESFEGVRSFLAAPMRPGVVVSDVRMPGVTGLDLLRHMQETGDPRPLILLTGHGDIEMAVQALKLGAFDFVEKPFSTERLLAGVEGALDKSQNTLRHALELLELKDRYASLSERQRDTMRFLVQGMSNKEIAIQLGISPRTVEIHRTWVMTRMSASSMAELVRMSVALEQE